MLYTRAAMSMKRAKARTTGPNRDSGDEPDNYFAKPKVPEKTWAEQTEGKPDDAFIPYSLETRFSKGHLLSHSKFGKGVVVHVEGARIEVLFADGPKKLGHAP
jgi:hypothetical protein